MLSHIFSLSEGISTVLPLALFAIGVAVYTVFIWKFYRFLARRDILKLDLNQYNTLTHPLFEKAAAVFFYALQFLVVFPALVFFWFLVLTALLIFLAEKQGLENILLVAMAVVAAVRITAYVSEDISKDVAKLLPFALLGVFLVDVTYFNLSKSLTMIGQLPGEWVTLVYYLLFAVGLEIVLRILSPLLQALGKGD